MNQDIIKNNVSWLCAQIAEARRENGDLNVTRAAELIGLNQTTLMRILNGRTKQLRPEIEEKIARYFKISIKDLYDPELKEILSGSRVDKLERQIKQLTPKEYLDLQLRLPGVKFVLE